MTSFFLRIRGAKNFFCCGILCSSMTSPMASKTMPTEATPLIVGDFTNTDDDVDIPPAQILMELVGAHSLELPQKRMRPYCVVRFGNRTVVHRTRPAQEQGAHPIWTIQTKSLCLLEISPENVNRRIEVAVWAKRPSGISDALSGSQNREVFCFGRIHMSVATVLNNCNEKRMTVNLLDECGREVGESAVSFRFRVASEEDVSFVRGLLENPSLLKRSFKSSRPLPTIITEKDEAEVTGARLLTGARTSSASKSVKGKKPVKPGCDPARPYATTYMTPSEIKAETSHPSHHWVEAGSGNIGRLYLEVLSCHNLPNTDIGSTVVGNLTDAFVCAVFEDALVETPVINDELSPYWLPWTQRAFVFNVMRPGSVLYLAVFGYKRGLLRHKPIGRVEVNTGNLQRDTDYHLTCNLSPSSHVMDRRVKGTIKIRLRMEFDNERAALLAVLKPPPRIYINVTKAKSFRVARYTCLGEYNHAEKFSLNVLFAYKDEAENYLRRVMYSTADAFQSLIFWRGQVRFFSVWLPFHSLILFCLGVFLIERPYMLPAVLFLAVAWFMLANMYLRVIEPSPWNRCLSFSHYSSVLLFGKSPISEKRIDANEGWEETQAQKAAWTARIEEDEKMMGKREAVEKIVDSIGDDDIQTQGYKIPGELLDVLRNVQGLIGGFLRFIRMIDAIVTWEESAVSFWIAAVFLVVGIISLFLPWAFILLWTCRILFWGFCGPHMRLVDVLWTKRDNSEKHFRKFAMDEIHKARIRGEEAVKLKAFRSHWFGEYLVQVPALIWTPHTDRPLPESTAQVDIDRPRPNVQEEESPLLPGQQLYGVMIPRPEQGWLRNREITTKETKRVRKFFLPLCKSHPELASPVKSVDTDMDIPDGSVRDQGIEVIDTFDVEAGFVNNLLFLPPPGDLHQSFVEPGVEISDLYEEEQYIFEQEQRGLGKDDFGVDDNANTKENDLSFPDEQNDSASEHAARFRERLDPTVVRESEENIPSHLLGTETSRDVDVLETEVGVSIPEELTGSASKPAALFPESLDQPAVRTSGESVYSDFLVTDTSRGVEVLETVVAGGVETIEEFEDDRGSDKLVKSRKSESLEGVAGVRTKQQWSAVSSDDAVFPALKTDTEEQGETVDSWHELDRRDTSNKDKDKGGGKGNVAGREDNGIEVEVKGVNSLLLSTGSVKYLKPSDSSRVLDRTVEMPNAEDVGIRTNAQSVYSETAGTVSEEERPFVVERAEETVETDVEAHTLGADHDDDVEQGEISGGLDRREITDVEDDVVEVMYDVEDK